MEAIIVLVAFLLLVLFIFAANIMSRGGITKRIFLFCDAICGHFSGGLAHANVLASMLFGGISGASNADAVACPRWSPSAPWAWAPSKSK